MGELLKSIPEATHYFIGLLFIWILLALLCSFIADGVSRLFRLRAYTLFMGISNLLGENLTTKFYSHPLIRGFAGMGEMGNPSYIKPRIFVWVLFDLVAPEWVTHPNDADKIREEVGRHSNPIVNNCFLFFSVKLWVMLGVCNLK
jgi:hypothetical protein